MTRILFLCGKARHRSPTAAQLAQNWTVVDADYAGLSTDADEPVTPEHLDWADTVFVMEARQKKRLTNRLGAVPAGTPVISLDIPDQFTFMEDALVEILMQKLTYHLGPPDAGGAP